MTLIFKLYVEPYELDQQEAMTIETEANGDSKSTNERGPSLVGSLGSSCRYKRFLSYRGCSYTKSPAGQAVVQDRMSHNVRL